MNKSQVSINIVLWDITKWGAHYLRPCLESVRDQSYVNFELNIVDNNSSDNTIELIRKELSQLKLDAKIIQNKSNPGLWIGQEIAYQHSTGEYILALSLDTILDKDFLKYCIEAFNKDTKVGALQAKLYSYNSKDKSSKIIDTTGFSISKSRRITNIGHGDKDVGQYSEQKNIFAVEGAVPIFRRSALDDIRINNHFADPNYVWYGDDLDIGWRLNLFGWDQIFIPDAIAYHDRSTTHDHANKIQDHLSRVLKRKAIPLKKRRLDWVNNRFTMLKNEYIVNVLLDLPWILTREITVLLYTLVIEPGVFLEYPRFFKLIPTMLRQRSQIMSKAKRTAKEIHRYYV